MDWKEDEISKVLIGSDLLSALYSLRTGMSNSHQDLLYEILTTYTRVKEKCNEIQLIWSPAHIGILGKARVDKLAKQITKENIEVNIKVKI